MSTWHAEQLIELMRLRYPDWDSFAHPGFLADEIEPKQKLVEKAQRYLSAEQVDALIAQGKFDAVVDSLEKLTRQTNLLWRRVPKQGDTAVFYHPHLAKPQFAIQIRNLLYGDRPSSERLQSFANYLNEYDLPNSWPLPTFLLYIVHPHTELLVRHKPATWLLKFMGQAHTLPRTPNANSYAQLLTLAHRLREALAPYQPSSMLDIQSAIWIGMRESKGQVGSLDKKSQVYLDIPPTPPLADIGGQSEAAALAVREQPNATYQTDLAPYSVEQMAEEIGHSTAQVERWRQAVERKGQLIFYGPPGTGKTFVAQKFARLLAQQDGFYELVQFHPAYSYEDFIEGLRPLTDENQQTQFVRQPGRFVHFCRQAEQHAGNCVLIIDEINRANITAVFGELMVLLEYRGKTIPLASGTPFMVPDNVKIFATMNSADRSLALVDFALRRRFSFISLQPNYELLRTYHAASSLNIDTLISFLNAINKSIDDPNYAIGHSYFLVPDIETQLQDIWEMDIMPYLREYFLEYEETLDDFSWEKLEQQL